MKFPIVPAAATSADSGRRRPSAGRRSATGRRRLGAAILVALLIPLGIAWRWGAPAGHGQGSIDPTAHSLAGVRLGDSRGDLVFRKGAPVRQRGRVLETADGVVVFLDQGDRVDAVVVDCARGSGHELLGIRCGTPVDRFEAVLGAAEQVATSADGTRRTYAWESRKVAFLVAQAKVSALILYADPSLAMPNAAVSAR